MELDPGFREQARDRFDVGADEVGHDRIRMSRGVAEGQSADGARELLELADQAGIDGPMGRNCGGGAPFR